MATLLDKLCAAHRQAGAMGLEAASIQALGDLRGVDAAGAAALLAAQAELGQWLAAALGPGGDNSLAGLAAALEDLARRPACLGCATCCRVSSPTLYAEDLALVGEGGLPRQALYALRPGERVYSARLGRHFALDGDLIKLREAAGGGCLFLEGSRCGLYAHRPLQCRHLECWAGRHAGQLEGRPRLSRRDLFAQDPTALALLGEYDLRLPGEELAQVFQEAAQGGDPAPALALLELDHRLRAGIAARYGYPPQEQDLLLGRPAWVVARAHGLTLALDGQGRPCLSAGQ
ncbi:MAG: YkgJ family cysteine cluster protein [Desulfarculus sp.]|nr:YkgJ family cysteine cluster protein [Desulfarculus sp.]